MVKVDSYQALIRECEEDERRFVRVERDGVIATVTLEDPQRYNSLTPSLCYQLHQTLLALSQDPALRVIILTGEDPAFCAGGDLHLIKRCEDFISEGKDGAATIWRWIRYQFGGIARVLNQSDKYFIAALNGPAAGVGLSFAFACDYLIGSERAELVMAFGKIGLAPEVGTNWHLTRRVGYHKAMELFIAGERISSSRALELGLINRQCAHEDILSEARNWALKVCQVPQNTTEIAKAQMRKCADMSWEQAITMEEFAEPICFTTEEHRDLVRKTLATGSV